MDFYLLFLCLELSFPHLTGMALDLSSNVTSLDGHPRLSNLNFLSHCVILNYITQLYFIELLDI